ncbi:putative GPI-anchored protein pfl2 [Branchiostoma floridae]|uniref:GPI-anchored protein pfl2 n=1 Tax=Branchiostoma floridae TaxID=7739 RepID=A0A9J7HI82_BRAFL|nr:putative GPI-anchored protein pfl2 [Branchiostoma floridae]
MPTNGVPQICGGSLNQTTGNITSPNWPDLYEPLDSCEWLITAPAEGYISLNFIRFNLTGSIFGYSCQLTDKVTIYDGNNTGCDVIGTLCAAWPPSGVLRSSGRHMFVTFRAQRVGRYPGFFATYNAMSPSVDCSNALGLENGQIKDTQLSASSQLPNYEAWKARLNGGIAWQFNVSYNSEPWLQVNLTTNHYVSGVQTQGKWGGWLTSYMIKYSIDGFTWSSFEDGKVFPANSDGLDITQQILDPPIFATYLRIYPLTWNGNVPRLRMELLGCTGTTSGTVPTHSANETTSVSSTSMSPPVVHVSTTRTTSQTSPPTSGSTEVSESTGWSTHLTTAGGSRTTQPMTSDGATRTTRLPTSEVATRTTQHVTSDDATRTTQLPTSEVAIRTTQLVTSEGATRTPQHVTSEGATRSTQLLTSGGTTRTTQPPTSEATTRTTKLVTSEGATTTIQHMTAEGAATQVTSESGTKTTQSLTSDSKTTNTQHVMTSTTQQLTSEGITVTRQPLTSPMITQNVTSEQGTTTTSKDSLMTSPLPFTTTSPMTSSTEYPKMTSPAIKPFSTPSKTTIKPEVATFTTHQKHTTWKTLTTKEMVDKQTTKPPAAAELQNGGSNSIVAIAAGAGGAALLLLVIIIVSVVCYKKKKARQTDDKTSLPLNEIKAGTKDGAEFKDPPYLYPGQQNLPLAYANFDQVYEQVIKKT